MYSESSLTRLSLLEELEPNFIINELAANRELSCFSVKRGRDNKEDYDIEVGTMNIVTRRLNRAITTQHLTHLQI